MDIKRTAAIAGVSELPAMKEVGHRSAIDLMLETGRAAILDAGLQLREVDGLLVAPQMVGAPVTLPSLMAEYMGIQPTYADVVDLGGATAAGMVWRAAVAIQAEMCNAVLCMLGDVLDPKSFYQRGVRWDGMPAPEFERPYGPMFANSAYALIAQRHAYEFGTTDQQRAKVAVDQRTNACANPNALFYGKPISIRDVLDSPLIVDPLRKLEIVMPCSGATAFVVTRGDRAKGTNHVPVQLLGFGEKVTHNIPSQTPSFVSSAINYTAAKAFDMAGIRRSDVQLASVYDCYTITVIVTLEDAGFCAKGRGGPFVEDHDLTYRGDFPVNTHGGQLSVGQAGLAGGATHITEAVQQLRGEANGRQIKNCQFAFVHGNGGMLSEHVSLVLGR